MTVQPPSGTPDLNRRISLRQSDLCVELYLCFFLRATHVRPSRATPCSAVHVYADMGVGKSLGGEVCFRLIQTIHLIACFVAASMRSADEVPRARHLPNSKSAGLAYLLR